MSKVFAVLTFHIIATLPTVFVISNQSAHRNTAANLFVIPVIALFSLIYLGLMWRNLYSKSYHAYLNRSISVVAINIVLLAAIMICAAPVFIVANLIPPRLYFQLMSIMIASFVILHFAQMVWIRQLIRLGFFRKNTAVVGRYDDRLPIMDLFQTIDRSKTYKGHLTRNERKWLYSENIGENLRLVSEDFHGFLHALNINEFIICLDEETESESYYELVSYCRQNSIGYYLVPDVQRLPQKPPWNTRFTHIPVIEGFRPARDSLIMVSIKRLFDIAASSIALVVLSPLLALIGLLILIEDGRPIVYKSTRVGIHGRKIKFLKFRSMVKNAEAVKAELLKYNERPDGPLFKMRNDPRVTRIGRLMRRLSIDELPQFVNVLRGDMSLIGPRPHLTEEVAEYSGLDFLRLECIPGISCLPQIHGRDTLGFREWVDLDLEYRKKWSMLLDLDIIAKTAKIVLRPFLSFSFKKN